MRASWFDYLSKEFHQLARAMKLSVEGFSFLIPNESTMTPWQESVYRRLGNLSFSTTGGLHIRHQR